jgi:hypothetical protein
MVEEQTTICSTMHCYNRATIGIVPRDGKWWKCFPNPAPICEECKNGNTPDMNTRKKLKQGV